MLHKSIEQYLEELNTQQRVAVEHLEGPILILAGAGTGKTKVLTTRIRYLVETMHIDPAHILAVTFTNKAAREMVERLEQNTENSKRFFWVGTFHSICAKILRSHAELMKLTSNFLILGVEDQLKICKTLLLAKNIDIKRYSEHNLLYTIGRLKNRGIGSNDASNVDLSTFAMGSGKELYQGYQNRLLELNAVDFDDLLLHTYTLFKQHQDVLKRYQETFRYILVDEYQDTNLVQYLWLRLLAQGHHNLACVGDDDQSIYSWRGAEVDNILRFEKDFKGAKVVRLEENYRSTKNILALASGLIESNKLRLGKTFIAHKHLGERPKLIEYWDSIQESREIAKKILRLNDMGCPFSTSAILVRTTMQMRELEEGLVKYAVPYTVIGGPRFYDRAEIKDLVAYLRCISNPNDDLAFERILNVPRRGLGARTLEQIHQLSVKESCPYRYAAHLLVQSRSFSPKIHNALNEFIDQLAQWKRKSESLALFELCQLVLKESGYEDYLSTDPRNDPAARLENINELLKHLSEFSNISEFLEHVVLINDRIDRSGDGYVSVMTLHAAKGLEFDTVFLPGWEEGIFPNQRSISESGMKGLEEERRLAYVGITRAKTRLEISYTLNRKLYGMWRSNQPSRFIKELPNICQSLAYENNSIYNNSSSIDREELVYHQIEVRSEPQRAQQEYDFKSSSRENPFAKESKSEVISSKNVSHQTNFTIGMRVKHMIFGTGTVQKCHGRSLVIRFDTSSVKTILDSFVTPLQ